jgi:ubiquinone/menaquinone biosynthesis C-methylase UbiE
MNRPAIDSKRIGPRHLKVRTMSLGIRNKWLLRTMIRMTQDSKALGIRATPHSTELKSHPPELDRFAAARYEYDRGSEFIERFSGYLSVRDLRGRSVLDLGCGYGGRTVYYAESFDAHLLGVETTEKVVKRCQEFAVHHACEQAEFRCGTAERIPCEDNEFDAVIVMDVLEHVQDPVRSIQEVGRVLRPGGLGYFIFPPYLGLGASHLEYITSIPGLHRIFAPDAIVETINEFLRADSERYRTSIQPQPFVGSLGLKTLPSLNGLTAALARKAIANAGLELKHEFIRPLLHNSNFIPGARIISSLLERYYKHARVPELLIASLGYVIEKPNRI